MIALIDWIELKVSIKTFFTDLNNFNPFEIANYVLGQNGRGYRGQGQYPSRQGSINGK